MCAFAVANQQNILDAADRATSSTLSITHLLMHPYMYFIAQAQGTALDKALVNDPDATLYSRLLASLKLRADETKTVGTMFVPTDRVSRYK